jgi:glycosyltransferase involved in cell wall biosynthesis
MGQLNSRENSVLAPRITVGLPVYQGVEHIAKALDCLQRQTFDNFEVIISVDGADGETAAACGPFLSDPRFRMVIQPERLDWFGNFNWLLQQNMGEFFCYRQHDDTTASEFFELLLKAADSEPDAAIVYCDCQWIGGRSDIEIAPSIEGAPLARMLQYVEQIPPAPVRGLIRSDAIRQAGLVRQDEFRSLCEIMVWLAKVLRWGNFRRVPLPLYYRLDHPHNYHKHWYGWPEERKRAAWTTLFTGLLEAAMPLCRTAQERLFLQQVILDRVVVFRPTRNYLYCPTNEAHPGGDLIMECFERLRFEGNNHLVSGGPTFDAEWYLSTYPDVRAEVESGNIQSALDHYRTHGYVEKRLPSKPVVDEIWYLQMYPDVAQKIREGCEVSGYDHFVKYGYREGRIGAVRFGAVTDWKA